MHASEMTNFSWHELICLMWGYIHTHIIGISLTLSIQVSTIIYPEISANEELSLAWGNIVLFHIRDDTGIGFQKSVPENI